MTTDNWQQFKELFQAALEIPVEERSAYLDRVCAEPSSRAELDALLLCYDPPANGTNERIANGEAEKPGKAEIAPHDPLVESFMDHYQIVKKAGQKGPATQYLAVRLNDIGRKQVVITIVKTATAAAEFLRSFRRERLILMRQRHPNIASFLDTGITRDGLPYLAMEHVEGVPVDEYCDSNKLTIHARLKLFINICDAVQYAHQRFIAHGGIGPGSILVTKDGIPKLLDLGIANLLNQELRVQGLNEARSDLEYVSPEQIRGEPITAADDVYSLGVLLYRLLTAHSPYRMKDGKEDELVPEIFEAVRPSKVLDQAIEQTRKEKLSTIRTLLAGDLDTIVLKAIQKDPSKRYASVEQFSEDLRRHLECRPVSARKVTFLYRASKLVKRRKSTVIAGACLISAFIVAFALMLEHLLRR